MRDRLIELLNGAETKVAEALTRPLELEEWLSIYADYLLANGVIVPPCKVGDKVYVVNTLFVSEYTINEMAYDNIFFRFYCANEDYAIECRSFMFFDERIGKTVFLTKEEAEKALKEREG